MQAISIPRKQKGFISSSTLLILAFSTAFFPRLLDSAGFPSAINFVHFLFVPVASIWIILQAPNKSRAQLDTLKTMLGGLFFLFAVMVASALLNQAGIINLVLSFLLWTEPFFFLLAFVWTPITEKNLAWMKKWIVRFSLFNIGLALLQKVFLDVGILTTTRGARLGLPQDNIQGVFYLSGGGHVVSSCVSASFALYYLIYAKAAPLWFRISVMVAVVMQNLFAETKQVTFVCLVAFIMLVITRVTDIRKFLQYAIIVALLTYVLLWCVANVPAFRGYNTWADWELYGPNGEATILKFSGIGIILENYWSPLNWLIGLGPGHTISRLGGWMLERYSDLLTPLGATVSPVADRVWGFVASHRLGPKSSMFSPLFGWAGLWGDFGFLGLGIYVSLGVVIWQRFCKDDFCKFLMLNLVLHGFIFTQLEEPGYMLFVAVLMGLRWHEIRYERLNFRRIEATRRFLAVADNA